MLNLRDDACCSVKNYNKELKGTLSICASTVPSQYILPKVVSAFREEYPHVTFNIQRQDSELVVENIAKGMADIGFCGTDTPIPTACSKASSRTIWSSSPRTPSASANAQWHEGGVSKE